MKVGIVSDTHMTTRRNIFPDPLLKGLEDVELIIHAGDWQTLEVYEQLSEIAPVEGVAGNVDDMEIIERFGHKKLLTLNGYTIGVTHGHLGKGRTTPEHARSMFEEDDPDLIIFGHSHIPLDEEIDGVRMFNPGSPTDKRWQPRFSFGLMTLGETLDVRHVYYDKT
ncbi:MAG TPA: metallophosphoesterase [Bacillales bacterium]|nr:metallophosphoesterase [Bacillales bacterium]